MPSLRSVLLHVAIAALAMLVVTLAAVAIGLSGTRAFGTGMESVEPVRLAVADWTRDIVRSAAEATQGQGAKID